MFYRFFKKYIPLVLITTLVFGIILFIKPIICFDGLATNGFNNEMPLFLLLKDVFNSNSLVFTIFAVLLILILANYLVRLNLKYFFIEQRTYLPAFFYLLLSSAAFLKTGFHTAIIGVLFLLFISDKILNAQNKKIKLSVFYDIGLLLATGSLFYGNLLYFLIFVFVGLFIVDSLNFRKSVIIIIGILTIYFMVGFYYFFLDSFNDFLIILNEYFFVKKVSFNLHYSITVLSFYLLFVLFIACINLILRFNQKKIIARKYIKVITALLAYSILCYLVVPGFTLAIIYFLLIPVSFILSDFFIHLRSDWIKEIFFTLFIALVVFVIIIYPI